MSENFSAEMTTHLSLIKHVLNLCSFYNKVAISHQILSKSRSSVTMKQQKLNFSELSETAHVLLLLMFQNTTEMAVSYGV